MLPKHVRYQLRYTSSAAGTYLIDPNPNKAYSLRQYPDGR